LNVAVATRERAELPSFLTGFEDLCLSQSNRPDQTRLQEWRIWFERIPCGPGNSLINGQRGITDEAAVCQAVLSPEQ
jgi:hypothetical protein